MRLIDAFRLRCLGQDDRTKKYDLKQKLWHLEKELGEMVLQRETSIKNEMMFFPFTRYYYNPSLVKEETQDKHIYKKGIARKHIKI